MVKKLVAGLLVAALAVPLVPSAGMCWYGGPPPPPRYHHHHHGGDAWLWGLGGLVLGSAIVATAMQPSPPPRQVVYVDQPPATYSYAPQVASRTCRWERYVLDAYGRTVFDRYGQPVKEYTSGPCDYPPSW